MLVSGDGDLAIPITPAGPLGGSGNIWEDDHPGHSEWLRSASYITLARAPATDAAKALTAHVVALIVPHRAASRPLRHKGLQTFTEESGVILAGLLRGAFKERPVSIQKGLSGAMWPDALIGNRAVWGKLDAMQRAGLVGQKKGVQTNRFGIDDPIYGGLPSRVWATAQLLDLARQHGVMAENWGSDWPISRRAETHRPVVVEADLIRMKDHDKNRLKVPADHLPPDQLHALDQCRTGVATLNACLATATFQGCRVPVFRRAFLGTDTRLHGRNYAVGADSFQSMNKEERGAILINGKAVVELDIRASFLSIFLGLMKAKKLPVGDPYALAGLPRGTVKAFITQAFGGGKLPAMWSRNRSDDVTATKVKDVREAVLAAYPDFDRPMQQILPVDMRAKLTADRLGWAVGQYLTFMESEVVSSVALHLAMMGTPALPMHDGLIVPASAARFAKGELERAFKVLIGVKPIVTAQQK